MYIPVSAREPQPSDGSSDVAIDGTLTWRAGREAEDTYKYEGGLAEYVQYLRGSRRPLHEDVVYFETEKPEAEIELAMQYDEGFSENTHTFVNNINTIHGGTHVSGLKAALTRTLNNYAQANNLLKGTKGENLSGEDIREGLTVVLSVRVPDPQFESQTKVKLMNPVVRFAVEAATGEAIYEFFETDTRAARRIVDKGLTASKARAAARKARDLVIRKSSLESLTLPGKLADCSSRDPHNSELFIVEGDSAGGSAKQGRDRMFQAILPLRGKILNVEKARFDRMLSSEETSYYPGRAQKWRFLWLPAER